MNLTNREFLAAKAQEIIALSKKFLTNKDGILIRGVDTKKNIVFPQPLIDELGDFLPFFAYFGDEETCVRHLRYTKEHPPRFSRAFSYTDLLLGLAWYRAVGKEKNFARSLGDGILKSVVKKHFGRFPGSYVFSGRVLPIFNTQDSTFLEIFTEWHRSTRDPFYLEEARRLFAFLTANPFFQKRGLLPECIITFPLLKPGAYLRPKKFLRPRIMKHNTNFGFGLLDLWRVAPDPKIKDAFHHLFEGLDRHTVEDGGVRNYPDERSAPADLVSSFAVADLMADGFFVFHDSRYLEFSKRVAEYWIMRQSNTTGLFPKEDGSRLSYLDNETDMAIVLFKLWELTGEQRYHESAERALGGILTHHKGERGYVLEVDIASGAHNDAEYKTKFNTLLLKPLIYLLSGKKIYGDETIYMLMKDR
ncbi:MAG: hypothetical protein AAB539_02340 [Patescibacteria group bacterium]